MEDDKIIMDMDPTIVPVSDVPVDTTLATTDDVIPAPLSADAPCSDVISGTTAITVASFFGTIQESVTITWRMHLKTRKHHIHVELNKFYDNAIKDVDDIIEQYQGIAGPVDEPFINTITGEGKTEVEYLHELKTFVETNKSVLGDHSEINSTIDNFLGHIDSAIMLISQFNENAVKSFDEFCYEDLNEGCKYDRFGERSCDDPDDPDYDEGESCGEEEE